MNKLVILSMLLGSLGTTAMLNDVELLQVNSLYQNKILDINFDTNEVKNKVNNKTYSTVKGTGQLVNSIKGKGFQTNSDLIKIPSSDLNIPTTQEYVTVSAQFKNGGTDAEQMAFAFGLYDVWIYDGWIGFNTAQADMYGVAYNLPKTDYVTITAVFHKSDINKCKLYINGVKQNLTHRYGNTPKIKTNPFSYDFYISSWEQYTNDKYLADGNNIIDEIMIFKSDITDDEAQKLSMAHRTPELSVRQEGLYAQANWATEILESDTIYNYGFEESGFIPTFSWNPNINGDTTGGQKLTTEDAYSGVRSIYTPKTTGGLGNHYGFPSTQSNTNIMGFSRLYIPNGTKLSVSFRAKDVSGTNSLTAFGDGGWGNTLTRLTPTIVETAPVGSTKIKVNSTSGLYVGQYITSERTTIYNGEFCRQIREIINNGDGTYTLIMNNGFQYEQKAGDNLHSRPWRGAWSFGAKTHNSNEWQLYNLNTSVSNYSDYDVSAKGGTFYINTTNQGLSYLDDVKFGYATKVKLYRDDNLIYEGYESQYNDTVAIDKSLPVMTDINVNSVYEANNRKITMTFPMVKDTGTIYDYSVKSIGNSGKETFLTEDKPITVTSGLKGYSYVIDKNHSTIPGNTVNLSASATTITHTISNIDAGAYYLHIKPIDNQGNVGTTKHILIDNPTLTAKANPTDDKIKLDWTMNNLKDKTFKVYQKKPGSSEFQSISATNFETTTRVNVLNIYPVRTSETSLIPMITFSTWDGETLTLPKSASLKQWMEQPNSENPKGYGKGIIEVTPVSIDDFNSNFNSIMQNSDGSWKYDVIMVGSWDGTGNTTPTISNEAINLIQNYIQEGRGFLAGHDTIGYVQGTQKGLGRIRDLFNIKVGKWNWGDAVSDEGHSYFGGFMSNKAILQKKGLLTNYPWNLGDVGTQFNIPTSHSTSNFAYGDIWMTYPNTDLYSGNQIPETLYPYANFYLTTWNNTAMIQTGHSNGSATSDEQKILANTLFYLNQLSSDNYLEDNSGQDVTAPNKPVIYGHNFTEDGFINLNFNAVADNGSTYEYYVQAEDKNGSSLTLSNTVTETITSGVKGYSYVVDSSPSTIPDNEIEQSTNETIKIKTNNSDELYVHIKAIDNVGNGSETYHYKITDITKPTLILNLAPSSWTNNTVTINATATDSGSGLKYIILPNGSIVKSTTATYTVTQNGIYYFKAIDYMGNETISSINVSNIDKKNPTVTITNNQNWTNQDVQVTITATDE